MSELQKILVITTVASEEIALNLAQELVENYFAACVNINEHVRSIYRWKGKVCDDRECLLIIKTRIDKFEAVKEIIKTVSDYEVPEIIAFPITKGSKAFLNWLDACLNEDGVV